MVEYVLKILQHAVNILYFSIDQWNKHCLRENQEKCYVGVWEAAGKGQWNSTLYCSVTYALVSYGVQVFRNVWLSSVLLCLVGQTWLLGSKQVLDKIRVEVKTETSFKRSIVVCGWHCF